MTVMAKAAPIVPGLVVIPPSTGAIALAGITLPAAGFLGGAGVGAAATTSLFPILVGVNNLASGDGLPTLQEFFSG